MPSTNHNPARSPFDFQSAAHLIRIGEARADTLGELLEHVRTCSEGSIFEHTFQTLQEHHFLKEGLSNDFAQWALAACNEAALAEHLTAVDVRDFTSIADLRERVIETLEEHLQSNPQARERRSFEPFYFCASELYVMPTGISARTLDEFAEGLSQVPRASIHYHFIDARLRLKLNSNDFSYWLRDSLDLPAMAERFDRIDIYTLTLEDVRRKMIAVLRDQDGNRGRA